MSPPIDVHPAIRERLLDGKTPVYFTDGSQKGDSAISRGLCCVSLPGVWGWKNETQSEFWEAVPLKSRTVYVVFDSDFRDNEHVKLAACQLCQHLKDQGADVHSIGLVSIDGKKVGLDDFFVAGGTAERLLLLDARYSEGQRQRQ